MLAAKALQINLISHCAVGPDGTVSCDPDVMRARTEEQLGRPLSLDAYSVARNVASEAGEGTLAEKIAIAEAAVNRARADGISISRLVMKDGRRYAKQSGLNPRVASSQDPMLEDLVAAELALAGRTGRLARGATHYFAPRYYGETSLRELFQRWASGWGSPTMGLAWVGPIAGVRPRSQFFMRATTKSGASSAYQAGLEAALYGEAPPEELCQKSSAGTVVAFLGLAALGGAAWYLWKRR